MFTKPKNILSYIYENFKETGKNLIKIMRTFNFWNISVNFRHNNNYLKKIITKN